MSKEYYTNWNESAPDLEELKEWWEKDQAMEKGYGNGLEWFMITCIEKDKFTDIIRALKEAEEKGFYSFGTSITEGKDGNLVLQCNTAKERYMGGLMKYICKNCDLSNPHKYPVYWEDRCNYLDDIELPLKEKCELVLFAIYSEEYFSSEKDNYENWNVRLIVRDIGSGKEREFGGGYLSREQVFSLCEDAKWLNKAEDYKEEMDPDIGYLTDPPSEDLDI